MSVDPLSFLDSPMESGSSQSESDPLDFLEQKSTNPLRKPARLAAQYAKGALNRNPYVAGYNLATTLVPAATHRSRERVSATAKKEMQAMDDKLARGEQLTRKEKMFYDRTKQLAERKSKRAASLDTDTLINKGVKATTDVDLEPEDLGESLVNIAGAFKNPKFIKNIPKMFTKEGRAAISADKIKAAWDSLTKAVKGNPEKEGLLALAQKENASPEAATLLIQSKGKIDVLGKIAKKTKKFKGAIEELHQKFGGKYEKLKSIGREGGHLGASQTESLANDLRKMSTEMDRTLIKGPDTKAAQKAIEEALLKLEMEGTTIGELVNTRINLGQQINWGNIDPKGAMLNEGRNIFLNAIEKASPNVANEVRMTDKGWAQYQKYADILDNKRAFATIKGIPIPSTEIAFGAAVGLKMLMGANPLVAAKYYGVKEVVQRLSTAFLINPKLQGVHKKLVKAILSGDEDRQRKLMVIAQKILKKDDPQLYDELGLED